MRVATNKHTHNSRDFGSRLDKRGILNSWQTTSAPPVTIVQVPPPLPRYKVIMSSGLSSPLASPKAKKSATKTKKSTAKAVKATKGDHPSWKDIIRVRQSKAMDVDFSDGVFQECIVDHPDEARTGVSRSTIKKVCPRRAFPT